MDDADLVLDSDRIEATLLAGRGTRGGYSLVIGGTTQSHVNPDDPTDLQLEYVRLATAAIDAAFDAGAPVRALHLGGGALTIPRYLAHTRPGSPQHVVELFGELYEFVVDAVPLPAGSIVTEEFDDARRAVERAEPGSRDLVVVDVFSGSSAPAHCTTVEFFAAAARLLAPGGLLVVNTLLSSGADFTREVAATLAAVLPELAVVAPEANLGAAPVGNIVLAASDRPLDVDRLGEALAFEHRPVVVLTGDDARGFIGDAAVRSD